MYVYLSSIIIILNTIKARLLQQISPIISDEITNDEQRDMKKFSDVKNKLFNFLVQQKRILHLKR